MKKIKVGINGFGRIGRVAARIILERGNLELAAINSGAGAISHAYLLKYDSTYGVLRNSIEAKNSSIYINGHKVSVYQEKEIDKIPWDSDNVDVVI
jgi:glyceraldehyde 3-phosphate dehydrogenase